MNALEAFGSSGTIHAIDASPYATWKFGIGAPSKGNVRNRPPCWSSRSLERYGGAVRGSWRAARPLVVFPDATMIEVVPTTNTINAALACHDGVRRNRTT